MTPTLLISLLSLCGFVVICAGVLRCPHCRRWHDDVAEEQLCKTNNKKGQTK